jgi:hypothetical protein
LNASDDVLMMPTEDAKDRIEMVRKFMKQSDDYRRPHLELASTCRTLYQAWKTDGPTAIKRPQIRLPYGFGIIESQVPQLVEALFGESPYITVEGNEPSDMVFEDSLTDFLDLQAQRMDLANKAYSFFKAGLLDGTAIAKVPWRIEEQEVETVERTVNPDFSVEESVTVTTRTIFDGPDFEQISIFDFFPDWTCRVPGSIEKMRACAFRSWRSLDSIREDFGDDAYKLLKHSLNTKSSNGQSNAWATPYFADSYEVKKDRFNDNPDSRKNVGLVEVWEWWGNAKIKGRRQPAVIIIANGDVELRAVPNPSKHKFKPFVAWTNCVRDGEFYGIPELLPVKGLLKEANVLRNARLDQVRLSIYSMYLVDRAAGVNRNQLTTRPSGIIYTSDMNGVRRLDPPTTDATAFRELGEIQAEAKDALGVIAGTPQLSQAARTFGRSATGVQYINSFTASRISTKVKLAGQQVLEPLYRMMLQWNAQFILDEQWVRVSDPNAQNPFTMLPPDAFERAIDFQLKPNYDTGGKDAEFAKLAQLGQFLQTAESTQPGITNWEVFFESVGRSLLGRRSRKFIRSPQERMALMQQQLATAQADQQATGAAEQGAPFDPSTGMGQ